MTSPWVPARTSVRAGQQVSHEIDGASKITQPEIGRGDHGKVEGLGDPLDGCGASPSRTRHDRGEAGRLRPCGQHRRLSDAPRGEWSIIVITGPPLLRNGEGVPDDVHRHGLDPVGERREHDRQPRSPCRRQFRSTFTSPFSSDGTISQAPSPQSLSDRRCRPSGSVRSRLACRPRTPAATAGCRSVTRSAAPRLSTMKSSSRQRGISPSGMDDTVSRPMKNVTRRCRAAPSSRSRRSSAMTSCSSM